MHGIMAQAVEDKTGRQSHLSGMKARRPNLYVINALRRRYGLLTGALTSGAMGHNQVADDLAHLGAVILMFDPKMDLAAIPPIRPYKPHRERWSRTALRILRTSDRPLRARELARMVMAAHRVPLDDHKRLLSISCGLQAVLGRLEAEGLVVTTGKPRRWAIAA
jgi:hypothetical protein